MKVFFTGSPRALKTEENKKSYLAIYNAIKNLGHQHLSDFVINANPDDYYSLGQSEQAEHYNKMLDSLKKADVVVVESSVHSMSMGFLLERALNLNKPVIVLYQSKLPTIFISGADEEKLQIIEYNNQNVEEVVEKAIDYAQDNVDVRFNFFISPSIGRYLDWISKEKKIPRSVYLRALIEQEMRENTEFNG